ncbi:MAG: CopD family protein [Saprospiraceae bacterium]
MEYYAYIKSVHLIFVVSWFVGLFYIVRLFIYQVDSYEKQEPDRTILTTEYKRIQGLLYKIIMTPAMYLTILSALGMILLNYIYLDGSLLKAGWFQIKLGLVVGLIIYHFYCGKMMKELHQDIIKWTSGQLRMWNEVATLFLVSIIFVVFLKNAFNWIYGVLGLIAFGILLMMAVKLAKRLREK